MLDDALPHADVENFQRSTFSALEGGKGGGSSEVFWTVGASLLLNAKLPGFEDLQSSPSSPPGESFAGAGVALCWAEGLGAPKGTELPDVGLVDETQPEPDLQESTFSMTDARRRGGDLERDDEVSW